MTPQSAHSSTDIRTIPFLAGQPSWHYAIGVIDLKMVYTEPCEAWPNGCFHLQGLPHVNLWTDDFTMWLNGIVHEHPGADIFRWTDGVRVQGLAGADEAQTPH